MQQMHKHVSRSSLVDVWLLHGYIYMQSAEIRFIKMPDPILALLLESEFGLCEVHTLLQDDSDDEDMEDIKLLEFLESEEREEASLHRASQARFSAGDSGTSTSSRGLCTPRATSDEDFDSILTTLNATLYYFTRRANASGKHGLSGLQKVTAALRMLAYEIATDGVDEYVQIGETTALDKLKRFCVSIVDLYKAEHLREPNDDVRQLFLENEKRGLRGMLK